MLLELASNPGMTHSKWLASFGLNDFNFNSLAPGTKLSLYLEEADIISFEGERVCQVSISKHKGDGVLFGKEFPCFF